MSYGETLTRRLICILFDLAGRPTSRQELARKYGVDAKTITRNINDLSTEFQIAEEKRGREVFYKFADGYKFKTPVFSPEEVAVLLLAQKSIEAVGIAAKGSLYAEKSASVLQKIRGNLPVSIKSHLDALAKVYGSAQIPEKDFSAHTEIIENLASCAIRRKQIEIKYHGLNSNEQTRRVLHPFAVYFDPNGATVKLAAFDPLHEDIRVFSVERINSLTELKKSFARPAAFDLEKYLEENCFNGIHGKPLKVTLKAKGITARIFAERKFHPTQKIIEHKPSAESSGEAEETVIELTAGGGRGLERFILSYLPEVEVVSPPVLRERVHTILRQSLPNSEDAQNFSANV